MLQLLARAAAAVIALASSASAWAVVPISTRWAQGVHPSQVPEYPRPQLARGSSSWQH
jgi:hypothetical protein